MRFTKLSSKNINTIAPYLKATNFRLSNYCVEFCYTWAKALRSEFSIVENCLLIKEKHGKNSAFYFPISASQNSADQLKATEMIEKYLIEKGEKQLCFCYVNDELLGEILHLYKNNIKLKNSRRWRDYLYLNESFFEYKGKKLSGQKSHVKAFKKEYPDYEVKEFKSGDEKKLLGFLDEFAQKFSNDGSKYAKIELKRTKKIIDKIATLNLLCVYIQVKQKVVALSIGEKIGDTLICHVEKALRGYSGAYPMMASEFSKMYKDATFLNREDDAGDLGLRTSKTQYKPLHVLNSYDVILNRKFDELKKIPTIKSERLVMKKIKKCDTKNYGKLNLDDELNRWWGYDYRGDLNGVKPTKNYFYKVQKEDFKNKTHICFGVYLKEKFIGEVVMQNFDFKGNAEIGMRIFKKYSGKGYAHEALKAVMKTMINKLSLEGIWAKCYKENIASKKALLKSGMSQSGSDERFFYFNR